MILDRIRAALAAAPPAAVVVPRDYDREPLTGAGDVERFAEAVAEYRARVHRISASDIAATVRRLVGGDAVVVVPADEIEIRNALNTAVIGGVDLVISVGGTGVSPRDVTPDATRTMLDRELLGIAEALRSSGLAAGISDAGLSRGLAGVSGSTLVVNIAGSRASVRDGMATLGPLAAYIIAQLSSLDI